MADAISLLDGFIANCEKSRAGLDYMLNMTRAPSMFGCAFSNGVWETREKAIARVEAWIAQEEKTLAAYRGARDRFG